MNGFFADFTKEKDRSLYWGMRMQNKRYIHKDQIRIWNPKMKLRTIETN